MFVITLNRRKITKILAVAVCVVAVGAAATGARSFFTKDSTAMASGKKIKLSTTQEMVDYIASKGFTADMQTARITEVQVPKKFDGNFNAFNDKIKQNDGLGLEKYKGEKINKWTFDLIDYDENDTKASAVLLLKKEKLIGAYILLQPDGTAVPMVKKAADSTAQDTSAQQPEQSAHGEQAVQSEAAAQGEQSTQSELTSADGMPTE